MQIMYKQLHYKHSLKEYHPLPFQKLNQAVVTWEGHGHSDSVSDGKVGRGLVVEILGTHSTEVCHHNAQLPVH